MTAEQRTVIEPKDILAIELECKACGSRVRYALLRMQPDVFKSRQHPCPNCKEFLADTSETNRIADMAESLLNLIKGAGSAIIQLEIMDERKNEARRAKTGTDEEATGKH
jgi:hypothetical protein